MKNSGDEKLILNGQTSLSANNLHMNSGICDYDKITDLVVCCGFLINFFLFSYSHDTIAMNR
jgi:hypothetical protein